MRVKTEEFYCLQLILLALLGCRTEHWFTSRLSPVHPNGDGVHPTLGNDPRPQVPGAVLHGGSLRPHDRLLFCLVRGIPRLAPTLIQASVHFLLTPTYLLRNDLVCVRWHRNGKLQITSYYTSILLYFIYILKTINDMAIQPSQ